MILIIVFVHYKLSQSLPLCHCVLFWLFFVLSQADVPMKI
jgi:hypothetical protein